MQKSKIQIIFKILASLILLWGISSVIYWLAADKATYEVEIPEKYEQIWIVSPQNALKTTVESLMTNERYQSLFTQFRNEFKTDESKFLEQKIGVDWSVPILIVKQDETNLYAKVKITNSEDFKQFAIKQGWEVAIIKNEARITIKGKLPKQEKTKTHTLNATDLLTVLGTENSSARLHITDNELEIVGEFSFKNEGLLENIPLNKGFLAVFPIANLPITNDKIPEEFKEVISSLKNVAIDYQGLEAGREGMFPVLNAVLQFKNGQGKETLITFLEKRTTIEKVSAFSNHYLFDFGGQFYTLQQLNATEWFVGVDENSYQKNEQYSFMLQGNPTYITHVKGNFLTSLGTNLIPGFTPTKNFLQQLNDIDIQVITESQKNTINGKISFKDENADFILELVKYVFFLVQS